MRMEGPGMNIEAARNHQPQKNEKVRTPSPEFHKLDARSLTELMKGVSEDFRKMRLDVANRESGRDIDLEADMRFLEEHVEELAERVQRLEEHATYDELTGLPNRRSFHDSLRVEVSHAHRLEKRGIPQQVHVLFIDVDHFKSINDTFGHEVGDLYLRIVSAYMRQVLHRDTDILARKGGDEFTAILFDCDKKQALDMAERLRAAVSRGSDEAKRRLVAEYGPKLDKEKIEAAQRADVTASIGVATLRREESGDEVLKRADEALYEAKESGKNRVVYARDESVGDGDSQRKKLGAEPAMMQAAE